MTRGMNIIASARSEDRRALVQVVHRPDPVDLDSSGDLAVILTRYDFASHQDSMLDATNGQILDNRVSTVNIERRFNWPDPPISPAAQCPALSETQADEADFRHGVVPDFIVGPCLSLNFSGEEFDSTLYDENPHMLEELIEEEYMALVHAEQFHDEAYVNANFIEYSSPRLLNLATKPCYVSMTTAINTSFLASLDQTSSDSSLSDGLEPVEPGTNPFETTLPSPIAGPTVMVRTRLDSARAAASGNTVQMFTLGSPHRPVQLPVFSHQAAPITGLKRLKLSSPEADSEATLETPARRAKKPLRRSERNKRKRNH